MEKRVSWQCPNNEIVLVREQLCSLSLPGSIKPLRTIGALKLVNLVWTIMTLMTQMMIAAMMILIQTD